MSFIKWFIHRYGYDFQQVFTGFMIVMLVMSTAISVAGVSTGTVWAVWALIYYLIFAAVVLVLSLLYALFVFFKNVRAEYQDYKLQQQRDLICTLKRNYETE
jgi:hypothetical protein